MKLLLTFVLAALACGALPRLALWWLRRRRLAGVQSFRLLFRPELFPKLVAELFELARALNKASDAAEKATLVARITDAGALLGLLQQVPADWFSQASGTASEGPTEAEIDAALERLATSPDTFGLDEQSGEEIPFERLDIIPYARANVAV